MKSMTDDLPALAKVVAVVGVPSVIALYLVYVLTASAATAAQVGAVDLRVDQHVTETHRQQEALSRKLETQIRLLRVMCASLAKTQATLIECSR